MYILECILYVESALRCTAQKRNINTRNKIILSWQKTVTASKTDDFISKILLIIFRYIFKKLIVSHLLSGH